MKKNYNLNIALIRVIFCISVLLYHLNLLKGGYLAVCSFFVLTGYFTTISLLNNKSLFKHYLKRIKKIYLPLIIVVFATLSIITIFKINAFNIKPEITSIILGYNNYWQLSANADYFAKHVNSPFLHLWYIAILLQLELVFPLIIITLKKIGDKLCKIFPIIIISLLFIITTIYFYYSSINKDIMFTYYDTFTRVFSYLLGSLVGLIHIYHKKLIIPIKNNIFSIIMFIFYIILLILQFIFIDASNKYFAISMILVTLITGRLIEYSMYLFMKKKTIKSRIIKLISDISYEIYLVQLPLIYFMTFTKFNKPYRILIVITSSIIISYLIYKAAELFKKDKLIIIRIIIQLPLLLLTLYGIYNYIIMKDYTNEMNILKDTLAKNEENMKQKQLDYLEKIKKETEEWNEYIKSLEVNEEELLNYVTNLKIVGIGDSILLDAIDTLYKEFPNGYFDGKVSRSTCAGAEVLGEIKNKGITWDVLVINLGTNDYPSDRCKDNVMKYAGDSKVFWLNATGPDFDNNNEELVKYADKHDNIYVLDWVNIVKDHPEYLYNDYIHLRPQGFKPYADFIRNEIYKVYLEEYNKEKEKKIKEKKNEQEKKISFYGNDLLLNIYNELQNNYQNAFFNANNKNFNELKNTLEKDKEENILNDKIVFVFDKNFVITKEQYKELIDICNEKEIYILSLDNLEIDNEKVKIIKPRLNKDNYLGDESHISKSGYNTIIKEIVNNLNQGES